MAELSPLAIENKLRELVKAGEELLADYRIHAIEAAEAETEYRTNYAKYLLQSTQGTVKEREAEAMSKCGDDDSMRRRKIGEAIADVTKQAMYMNRAQLSAVQTMARQIVDEMKMSGWGTP